jgi:hypothetical protein
MLAVALSLFLSNPAPLDMPRAEAYLVRENGAGRIEERYRKLDLWTASAVEGRWIDGEGRVFWLAKLADRPPPAGFDEYLSRSDFEAARCRLERKDKVRRREAIELLSPIGIAAEPVSPRQLPRGCDALEYWQGTNSEAIVAAFRAEKAEVWHLAIWQLAAGDDAGEMAAAFEEGFLLADARGVPAMSWKLPERRRAGKRPREIPGERELMRRDVAHSITNYPSWRFTDAGEFAIVDALPRRSDLPGALATELPALRRRFVETVPSAVDVSNTLFLARIYSRREDYLAACGEEMAWSAAYWSTERREIVACLGEGGESELVRHFRHEAFHQYMSYAAAMATSSPWFNEGYAQYFEDEAAEPARPGFFPEELGEASAAMLPELLLMDYGEFYAGSAGERALKYRLAWMVAYFIERGAGEVRNDPFAGLKRDYMHVLTATRDMHRATEEAFGGVEGVEKFVAEWKKFWVGR